MSRPQAITAANLTQEQTDALIQVNPSRASILQPSDQFLPPSIPLYLPDPERNKSKDDYYLLAAYSRDGDSENSEDTPVKVPLSLDSFVRPPPLPSLDSTPINFHVEQAEKEKSSYSYNNRYDYYFPVKVVYDDNQNYAEKELQLMEMQPPSIHSDEPNYYDIKPKKVPKKYQPNKKDVNHSKSYGRDDEENVDRLVPIDNDGLVLDSEHTFVTSQPVERFAPAPSYHELTDADLNTGEYIPKLEQNTEAIQANAGSSTIATAGSDKIGVQKKPQHESGESKSNEHKHLHKHYSQLNESNENDERYDAGRDDVVDNADENDDQGRDFQTGDTSETGKRVEFQMHGFKGPNSYKFGYDTGLG